MHNSWSSTDDLTNLYINKNTLTKNVISKGFLADQYICAFSHVPKTAGTSIEAIVAKNFLVSEVLHVNAPDLNRLPGVIRLKKNHPKFVCGHHPLHGLLYQLLPKVPLFHFTQLRNPVDRVVSYFNYVKGKSDHPMHHHAADDSMISFLLKAPSPELNNGQAKRFSGYLHSGSTTDEKLFAESKDALSQCFSLVLTTCLFDEGLLLLKNRLGLKDIFYQKRNVSEKFVHKDALDDVTLNFILENNQADMQLFEWAKQQCHTLVNDEISIDELNQFKADNKAWQQLINS